jgi:signal transduction histidine kinase
MAATEGRPDGAAPSRRRTRFRRQLRSRIILAFVLLGFGLTTLFAFAAIYARNYVEDQLIVDVLNRNINSYAAEYFQSPGPEADPTWAVPQMYGRVVDPNDPLELAKLRADYPGWVDIESGVVETFTGTDQRDRPMSYRVAALKTPDAWFFLAYNMGRSAEGARKMNRWLYASVFIFTAFSLLVGWWAASRVMSPVSELARRIKQSGRSTEPESLATHFPNDEVGQLAEALDDYAARLTDVVQRDREFNADVSHELRTPLSVIRGAAELMLSRPDLDEKTRSRLLRVQRAEQQCTDLISALLLLSRSERGHGSTDVARVAEQLLEMHRTQLAGKPLELRLEGEHHNLIVDAPEAAIAVALGNLIGNAVKYTRSGAVIVRMHADAVEVIDSGPGLSAEDAAKLFERGYRGTHAGHSQGGGIGLSIVRRLCDLYGWDVRVMPGEVQGVVATLTFARAG